MFAFYLVVEDELTPELGGGINTLAGCCGKLRKM